MTIKFIAAKTPAAAVRMKNITVGENKEVRNTTVGEKRDVRNLDCVGEWRVK